jgi:hypothetical protein
MAVTNYRWHRGVGEDIERIRILFVDIWKLPRVEYTRALL